METRFLSDSTLYESVEMNFNNTNCAVLRDPPKMNNLVTYAFFEKLAIFTNGTRLGTLSSSWKE